MTRSVLHISIALLVILQTDAVVMVTSQSNGNCKSTARPFADVKGNLTIVGLFDLHRDRECQILELAAMHRMLGAVWAVQLINSQRALGDLQLGFKAYSTCSDVKKSLQHVIESLNELDALNECTAPVIFGFLGPTNTTILLAADDFLKKLNILHLPYHMSANLVPETETIVAILKRLHWTRVVLVAENTILQKNFLEWSSRESICVSSSFLLSPDLDYTDIARHLNASDERVVVFLGLEQQLRTLLMDIVAVNHPKLYFLLGGPRLSSSMTLNVPLDDDVKLFLVQSADDKIPSFEGFLKDEDHKTHSILDPEILRFLAHCNNNNNNGDAGCNDVDGNSIIGVVESVTKMVDLFLSRGISCEMKENDCNQSAVEFNSLDLSLAENGSCHVMSYQSNEDGDYSFAQVGEYSDQRLTLRREDLGILHDVGGGWFKIPEFKCVRDCSCINNASSASVRRSGNTGPFHIVPWVAVCGTVSCIGTLLALAIMTFLLVRHAGQAFSLLLLTGIIATYAAVLPFFLAPSESVCAVRVAGVGLVYALLYAPLVARCLMLATCDTDGLPGHVSGVVQSSLFFFMAAVQVALDRQLWRRVIDEAVPHSRQPQANCHPRDLEYLYSMSYVIFLVLIWLAVSPMCVRNRRNYHEGLFSHLASLATLLVWIGWLTAYLRMSRSWHEPVVCFGLFANASVVLLVIFLPRVYKVIRSTALDTATDYGSSTEQNTVPSLTDMTLRTSNTMIYETVNHAYAQDGDLKVNMENGERLTLKPPTVTHL